MADWHYWFVAVHKREADAAELTHFLNLNTAAASAEANALKWQQWARQDREGRTPEWRSARGLYADQPDGEVRRLPLHEL